MILTIGTRFSTPFETGCVVTMPNPEYAKQSGVEDAFLALDSDGVQCEFTLDMVTFTW